MLHSLLLLGLFKVFEKRQMLSRARFTERTNDLTELLLVCAYKILRTLVTDEVLALSALEDVTVKSGAKWTPIFLILSLLLGDRPVHRPLHNLLLLPLNYLPEGGAFLSWCRSSYKALSLEVARLLELC